MCAKCIKESVSLPFTCASKPELDKHMSSKHKEDNYLCRNCYSQYGALTYFATDRQLKQHQKDHDPLNDSTDWTHLSIASVSESSSMALPHFLIGKHFNTEISIIKFVIQTYSPWNWSELNVLSKETGITNLAKRGWTNWYYPQTASELFKEKESDVK